MKDKEVINLKFREAFEGFHECYTIIGGTACEIILSRDGVRARTTKDYDILIHEQGQTDSFYKALLGFLHLGNYEMSTNSEKENYYRFTTKEPDFPEMLEFLCRRPNFAESWTGAIAPISFTDEDSLSAIMLDEHYYLYAYENSEVIKGVPILNRDGLLVLKARAWYNLFLSKMNGDSVISKDVKKHISDISRIVQLYEEVVKIQMTPSIEVDMALFLNLLKENINEIPQSKDYALTREEVLGILETLLR